MRALAPSPPPEVVAERLEAIRGRIVDAGRDPDSVRVVAVTKGFSRYAVDAARAVGLVDIGENYASELLDKATGEEQTPTRWHYLGTVQRRQVARLAPVVACWQTVCRVEEGETIAARAPGASVLVEIDITGMAQRNGAAPDVVPALVTALRALGLAVHGLMVVGPPGPPEAARPAFRAVAALARDLELRELSMGMSDDLEVAAAEGSTMVRVGRALFGQRPPR